MTWDRLRMAGYLLALVLLGAMLISLYGAFRVELENSSYIGFIGGVVLGAVLVALIAIVLLVPEQRRSAWVSAITNVNARYLFGGLVVLWLLGMGFLASFDLSANSVGPPALVGMFLGIFIFMGFIWSVIGE
jgi:hypothetical protein